MATKLTTHALFDEEVSENRIPAKHGQELFLDNMLPLCSFALCSPQTPIVKKVVRRAELLKSHPHDFRFQVLLIGGSGDVSKHASANHSRASLYLIVEPGLYTLLRFQKAAMRGNYETGNQAFSMHLRFLTIRLWFVIQGRIVLRCQLGRNCQRGE